MQSSSAFFSLYCTILLLLFYTVSLVFSLYIYSEYIFYIFITYKCIFFRDMIRKNCQNFIFLIYALIISITCPSRNAKNQVLLRDEKEYMVIFIFWEQLQHSQHSHCQAMNSRRADSMCFIGFTAQNSVWHYTEVEELFIR